MLLSVLWNHLDILPDKQPSLGNIRVPRLT